MNILQIIPELKLGGTERGTVELARGLVARGHRSVVISGGGELVRYLDTYGTKHYTLPVGAKNPWTIFQMVRRVCRIIEEEHIDVVHARSRVPGLIAFLACRKTSRPLVTTCHGYYRKNFFGYCMGWGKRVIVSSQAIGRHMLEDFEVSPERIRLIPRGVDLDVFTYRSPRRNPQGEFTIGMIGRITPLKGHLDFIRAISRVVRAFPKIKVLIVGDAPPGKTKYRQELELLVKRLGLHQTVQWAGTSYDIPKILSEMDLLVLASKTPEAFGRVMIEAGACGVPVVATRVGGVVDVVTDGKEGLLVPPEDPLALAEAILRILKDPSLASAFAKRLREKVEKEYSLGGMIDKTLMVYEEALKKDRILVVKLGAVGDVVLAVPSLRAIRKKFVKSHITLLVGRDAFELVQHSPYLDDIVVYDSKRKDKRGSRRLQLASELRRRGFDQVIDLQNNKTSQLLSYLSLAPKRFGFDRGLFRFLVNRKLKDPGSLPPVEHQGKLLRLLGIETVDPRLELWPQPKDEAYVGTLLQQEWLAGNESLVGVNLGGSIRWETKRWPVEYIAELCDRLGQDKIRVVLTGTEQERNLAQKLLSQVHVKPIVAIGKTTLPQLASLIRRCRAFVTVDSAPLHLAASMDTPVIALFGPTDPKRHFPPVGKGIVLNKKVKCHPCYLRRCPIGLICMTRITPQEVYQEVKRWVQTPYEEVLR
ncbi:MAG: glycosyltransferase [Candidatus Omnitrophica bacterium]|nr:glycosyltransferase [Candidatus Omnitrophota bacterium]